MRARVMAVLAVPWVIAFPPGREALVTERYALFRVLAAVRSLTGY